MVATTDRGGDHGPPVVPTGGPGLLRPLNAAFRLFALICGLLVLGYLHWAFWAYLLPL